MTTQAAERLYEAQHLHDMEGRKNVIYNPLNRPLEELPAIYGFNNGGREGWMHAVLLAEDGTCLGGHICSTEGYMPNDLGILEGTRPDRHETFRGHYPDGYRMEFIPTENIKEHEKLNKAFELNQKQRLDAEGDKEA
jgi:hypothetical protein